MADICSGCQYFTKEQVQSEVFGKTVNSKTYHDVDIPAVGIKCMAKCGNQLTEVEDITRAEYSQALLDTVQNVKYQEIVGFPFAFEDDTCPNYEALT